MTGSYHMDFAAVLLAGSVFTGVVWAIDSLFFKAKRIAAFSEATKDGSVTHEPKLVEYCRSFFPILLIVLLLRSFLAEPFRIPSGSMKPTLLEGDFILVNKYEYGFRLPVIGTTVIKMHHPKRGDVMVFRYPVDTRVNFIKRVVGVPGDTISYHDKTLFINGEAVQKVPVGKDIEEELNGDFWPVDKYRIQMGEKTHEIFLRKNRTLEADNIVVPEGHYFVMGDNRDNSEDSREWGLVPDEYIVGRAFLIWMSWNSVHHDIRWKRLATVIE